MYVWGNWECSESLRAVKVIEVIKENEINISLFQIAYLSHGLLLQNSLCIFPSLLSF